MSVTWITWDDTWSRAQTKFRLGDTKATSSGPKVILDGITFIRNDKMSHCSIIKSIYLSTAVFYFFCYECLKKLHQVIQRLHRVTLGSLRCHHVTSIDWNVTLVRFSSVLFSQSFMKSHSSSTKVKLSGTQVILDDTISFNLSKCQSRRDVDDYISKLKSLRMKQMPFKWHGATSNDP